VLLDERWEKLINFISAPSGQLGKTSQSVTSSYMAQPELNLAFLVICKTSKTKRGLKRERIKEHLYFMSVFWF